MSDTPLTAPATSQTNATTAADSTQQQPQQDFPPTSIDAFLRFCAGEWLSLRSQLTLGLNAVAADPAEGEGKGEDWHSSERAELSIVYLSPDQVGEPGGLGVSTKAAPGQLTQVRFSSDGHFSSDGRFNSDGLANGSSAQPEPDRPTGRWTLWPDGSLELVISTSDGELSEKIWFTKPNLRLRSTVETRADGSPGRASFSSEIRRVSRPAT
ncbi:MAG: Chromophore lyase CpcS/CpeS [Cyanobacteriota bacterium]